MDDRDTNRRDLRRRKDQAMVIDLEDESVSRPNKALEPTSTSVTLRAIVCFPEMKRQTEFRLTHAARPLWPWLIFDVGQDFVRAACDRQFWNKGDES